MFRRSIRYISIGWAGRLALQRLFSQWRTLLTIIAAVMVSAVVGALVPLYTTAVAQVGMVEQFRQIPPAQVHVQGNVSIIAAATPDFSATVTAYDAQFRSIILDQLSHQFPQWINQIAFYGETSALDVIPNAQDGESVSSTSRGFVAYYEGWQEAVNLVAGSLPTEQPNTDTDIEIVVPFEAQRTFDLSIGDVLLLDQGGVAGGWPSSKNVRARIVGIAALPSPLSELQRGYFMAPSPLRVDTANKNYLGEYPVLTTKQAFERVAAQFVPDTPTKIGWRVLFDHTRLPFSRSPQARQALFDLNNDLRETFSRRLNRELQFNYSTALINWKLQGDQNIDQGVMLAYEQSIRSLDAPFGLLLLQIGALVIFFLLITASLVRRSERREIAMLQSRGATDRHIVLIRGAEALIICIVAALCAPFVAQQLLILITPFFAQYSGLPLELTPTTYAFSAGAAFVAFIVLMLTIRPVLRLPLISAGGSTLRSERRTWWQRYYADVLLIVIGIASLWRLTGKDSPLFVTVAGTRTTDPFLLLAPTFLFLGLGSILLRLFPLVAGIASRILGDARGLSGAVALWQLSRESVHYARLTFLLSLAVGIGWFATSFRATITRSQSDQAQYQAGTDMRYDERDLQLNAGRARPEIAYTQVPGVQAVSVIWRQPNVNFQTDPSKTALYAEVLAVDADTFNSVYYWRPDLGAVNLPRELGQRIVLPERGAVIPSVPRKLTMWANFSVRGLLARRVSDLDRLRNRTTIYARLLDGAGAWLRLPFKVVEIEYRSTGPQTPGIGGGGSFASNGWAYLEADLSSLKYAPVGPVRLVSVYWQHRGRVQGGERDLQLTLAGISADDGAGSIQPLDVFNRADWQFDFDTGALSQGSISASGDDGRHGQSITAVWDQTAAVVTVGALLNYPEPPAIPLIASTSLAAQLRVEPGQSVTVNNLERRQVNFSVTAVQGYYPTLYDAIYENSRWTSDERNHPFAVVDRDALLYALNRRPSAALYGDEVWLKLAPGATVAQAMTALQPDDGSMAVVNVQTLVGAQATLQTDPLSLGLLGLMFLAFIIATSLSVVGLMTYAAVEAVSRRAEFGVLRALGLSSGRLVAQIAIEQLFVIGLGALLGGTLGAVLSSQVVPRLAQDASAKHITPPFIIQVETAALVQYGVVIVVVFALVILAALMLVRHLSLSQSLRLGEE